MVLPSCHRRLVILSCFGTLYRCVPQNLTFPTTQYRNSVHGSEVNFAWDQRTAAYRGF
ncbi:hypothetical protein PF005_g13779 [Phytophthora fragariae]|uniref:Uncharacterized protein n=1 Tax=Phytophthora fragariae TaxID=53985 RepID=A0A6A3WEJ2_9STRA|nr:hypothetical protein PF003_g29318 [Phytophthora fragariae]KAE8940283.1 hypothetical protein PF009_g9909 [Phytophthora fragariae]KAE9075912.1 hypothetical protein PF007_g24823 [Phytophthora fragariae]KAE9088057.1 hypothetical protein PF006_g25668 [Phytophthora fragariae]KAE9169305.1 hypothetical protein PF004_g28222 [Phytophthora fragariae]